MLAPLAAVLFVGAPPAPVTLRLKPKVGARLQFAMNFTIDLGSGTRRAKIEAASTLTERTLAVKGDRITLERGIQAGRVVGTGTDAAAIADTLRKGLNGTYTVVIDRQARTVTLGTGAAAQAANTIDVTLPAGPIAPGGSWEGFYGSNKEMKLRYTLREVRSVVGRRVALIDLSQPGATGTGLRLKPGGMFALDLADGRWLRATASAGGMNGGVATGVRYDIARKGAPGWSTILAAFPKKR